ncbi:MAG: hypothetical protein BGN86_05580 [Caulobacterales bacterium 68-7]|nr:MAG: hypothetical protein BGN86_05580 [Caulobacterales bacterium 68-7]
MVVSAGVERLAFADSYGLFHQGRQDLVALNATADHIWQAIAAGRDTGEVAAELAAQDPAAAPFVADAVEQWLAGGWMLPADVAVALEGEPHACLELCILDIGFSIETYGAAPPAGVLEIFQPLAGAAAVRHRLQVAEWRGRYVLVIDGFCRGLFAPDAIAPSLKGGLTNRLTASVADGFLAHGALVAGPRRLFLSGAPGAGKSTLALALGQAGFQCLSDDIIHVDPRGHMRGAPFPPGLKTGAWPLLASVIDGLDAVPIHRRADGQFVRFLPSQVSRGDAGALDAFVVLDRRAEGPAEILPLSGLEAVHVLLASAFAAAGRISAEQVRGLAAAFAAARCLTLRYSDLPGAVRALRALVPDE